MKACRIAFAWSSLLRFLESNASNPGQGSARWPYAEKFQPWANALGWRLSLILHHLMRWISVNSMPSPMRSSTLCYARRRSDAWTKSVLSKKTGTNSSRSHDSKRTSWAAKRHRIWCHTRSGVYGHAGSLLHWSLNIFDIFTQLVTVLCMLKTVAKLFP